MFCFKCGASMPDDSAVCPQCATPVQGVTLPPQPPPPPQAGASTPASTSAWLNVPPAQSQYPPQGQSQTDGGAIVSMVLGIASFALCLSFITGIPAIILGHISWSKIRRSAGRLKGEGMALTGLILGYLSLPFILIVAAIAIPNLLRARISANESAAMSTVRTINTIQVTYEHCVPVPRLCPRSCDPGQRPRRHVQWHRQRRTRLSAGRCTGRCKMQIRCLVFQRSLQIHDQLRLCRPQLDHQQ